MSPASTIHREPSIGSHARSVTRPTCAAPYHFTGSVGESLPGRADTTKTFPASGPLATTPATTVAVPPPSVLPGSDLLGSFAGIFLTAIWWYGRFPDTAILGTGGVLSSPLGTSA